MSHIAKQAGSGCFERPAGPKVYTTYCEASASVNFRISLSWKGKSELLPPAIAERFEGPKDLVTLVPEAEFDSYE